METQPVIAADAEQVVRKALDQIGEISTLPEVTLKIIETVEDPSSTAKDLHEIVTHDLALSAKILRVVNSAFYGLPGQIASVDRAIVMLGLNAVKNITIAASLSRVFRGGRLSRKYSARDVWTHSLAVGTCSKMIVEQLKMALPDEAFVGGLIHDIGLVVMLQNDANKLAELLRMAEQKEEETGSPHKAARFFREAEKDLFGAGHEAFGAGLAREWKFPRSFQYITGYHHRPEQLAPENRLLTLVVNVADSLCCQAELGMVLPIDCLEIEPEALEELGLSDRRLDIIREDLPEQVELASGLFS